MLTTCWSVKGGSGTTVVAAALAVLAAEQSGQAWLVDLAGDGAAVLGAAEPSGPGIGDWLAAPASVGPDAVARLAVPLHDGLCLVPAGTPATAPPARWELLAQALRSLEHPVVVDARSGLAPLALRHEATHDLLVTRGCYLALRRAAMLTQPPGSVVLVGEVGRVLRRPDVERAVGAPVVAEIEWDPAVARAIDAGLLAGRLPRSLRSALRGVGALTPAS